MKRTVPIWSGIILLLIFIAAGWFFFKKPVDEARPDPAKPHHIKPEVQDQKIKGTVLEYGSNPDGDIDKILLETSEGKIWLHFPPHAARSVKALAMVGSVIEVLVDQGGPAHHQHDAVFELKHLEGPAGKASIDLSNIPAPAPRKGFEVEIKGNTKQDLKIAAGTNNNFVLSGKLISVPPHIAQELFPLIKQAKMILVKGYMRDSTEGFLSASGLPVVKANLIQLDDVTYKLR